MGKISKNLYKIPENVSKLPENTSKNGTQNHMRSLFFGGHFLLEFFQASLGEFGQKSFATPKICLLVLYTYAYGPVLMWSQMNYMRLLLTSTKRFSNLARAAVPATLHRE